MIWSHHVIVGGCSDILDIDLLQMLGMYLTSHWCLLRDGFDQPFVPLGGLGLLRDVVKLPLIVEIEDSRVDMGNKDI